MSQVRTYTYRELTPGKLKPSVESAEEYEEANFVSQPEQVVVSQSEKKDLHFRLDATVASQLGLEEKEKKVLENKVREEIERRWEKTSEKAEVSGFTKGLEEGKGKAYQSELPRIQDRLQRLDTVLQEMDKFREKIFLENEGFLMDLIGQVTKMILLKEISIDKEYIHRVVISLLHQIGTKEDTKVFLSNGDFQNIELLKTAINKEFGVLSNLQVEANDSIPDGGCKIETRFGVVDATISTQIENVMRALKT